MASTVAHNDAPEKRVQVIARIPEDLDHRLEVAAANLRVQKGRLIEEAIREHLKRLERRKK